MRISKHEIKELLSLYDKESTVTSTARKFCDIHNIDYNDSFRRSVSRLLNKEWKNGHDIFPRKRNAKILIFDIETMPMEAYIWSLWQNNVGLNMLKDDWYMLSWSAKWLFKDEVMAEILTPEEISKEDDYRITKALWDLFNEADIVIAHNGKKFDIKRVNTRFLKHKMSPPLPYVVIDTLLTLRKKFAIVSNKLDYVAKQFFGFEGKSETGGFDLWRECKKGNETALEIMKNYNIQDVKILEEVYLRIRPWIQPHPNINLYIDSDVTVCPACGGSNLIWQGAYTTYANEYRACRCADCGAMSREKTAIKREVENIYSLSK